MSGVRNHMKTLNILHTESSCGWGGQEIRILTEIHGTLKRGHRVTLIKPAQSNIAREAQKSGIATVCLDIEKKGLRALLALRTWLKQNPVDVINTHSSTDSWLAALACATLKNPPAIVRTRHISSPIPNNFASRWLYQRATALTATTGERLREQLISTMGLKADRVQSVPTGIDLSRYRPLPEAAKIAARQRFFGQKKDIFVVGIVATLRSWKGHSYLLDAIKSLPNDVHCLIVGDGPQTAALQQKINDDDLNSRVSMTGNLGDVEIALNAFDCFVLPSYANEGVPQALMQAMSCGLAVIATPVGSVDEIVSNNETGLMVPFKDSAAIAAAITQLRTDGALRTRLSAAALSRAQARFGDNIMVDKMEMLFQRAAQGKAAT
jgi:glycosyltransferase involved in cell wall biosynthesis